MLLIQQCHICFFDTGEKRKKIFKWENVSGIKPRFSNQELAMHILDVSVHSNKKDRVFGIMEPTSCAVALIS